ncbi:DUF6541 family protein [Modestobacter marinus]|uniref:DUF6541 family protein n=1 Tax=Modestobacter marinus TaxID=477641 RepID=UPI001C9869BF|nr:DUF6541 family protein [Modestobacter marinus]
MPPPTPVLLLVSLATLLLPGAAVAVAAGLRLSLALAAAPLVTYGLATATGTVATVLPVSWQPWLLAVEAAALAGLLLAVRRGRRRAPRPGGWPPARDLVVASGVLAGAVLSAAVLLAGFGDLGRPNQDWDYTFHANATRFTADTGQVAPAALRAVNDWESSSFFYPDALHAVAAVVRDLTGAPVFAVLNSGTLLIAGTAGLGLAVLLRDLGAPTAATATAPLLLAGAAGFPYDLVARGPVLPYAAGLALLPAFLALVRELTVRPDPGLTLLTGLGGAALFGLQPSTALAAGLVAVPMLVQQWATRRWRPPVLPLLAAAALAGLLAAPVVLGSVRTSTGGNDSDWPAVTTPGGAVLQALTFDEVTRRPQLVLAVLVLAGLLVVRSARYVWWCAAAALVPLGLFVLAASSESALAAALTRPWWNDRWRLTAWLVLCLVPLAAHGLAASSGALARVAGRLRRPTAARPARPELAAAAVLTVVVVASGGLYAGPNSHRVSGAYQSDRYLDADETAAMAWLADRVGPGERVMNDAGDGSAYMAAVAGLRPVFGHQVNAETVGPVQALLRDRFSCLDSDRDVRHAIGTLGIRYVFVSEGYVRRNRERAEGLTGLADSPSVALEHARGAVRIYRVQLGELSADPRPACRAGQSPP